jgi:hypothetical protein
MSPWAIPDWAEPFDPSFEVPILESLASSISSAHPEISCTPFLEIEGCAFVNFYRGGVQIGRACVTANELGLPFFSVYMGAEEDEFHGVNQRAIVQLVAAYETQFPQA